MTRPRHTRKDLNHRAVIAEAMTHGVIVWDLSDIGGYVLDTVMFWKKKCVPVEIKQPGHEQEFTNDEKAVLTLFRAWDIPFIVATCWKDIEDGWPT